jgi:predicted Zn-dependent protease with MMP-like domain
VERLPRYRFDRIVAEVFDEAMDDMPAELHGVLDNVVVRVEDRHPDEPDVLGLYDGVPHTERTGAEGPDVVTLYREALCDLCDDEDDLAEEIYVTIVHELAHAAGIDDDRLDDLGWG